MRGLYLQVATDFPKLFEGGLLKEKQVQSILDKLLEYWNNFKKEKSSCLTDKELEVHNRTAENLIIQHILYEGFSAEKRQAIFDTIDAIKNGVMDACLKASKDRLRSSKTEDEPQRLYLLTMRNLFNARDLKTKERGISFFIEQLVVIYNKYTRNKKSLALLSKAITGQFLFVNEQKNPKNGLQKHWIWSLSYLLVKKTKFACALTIGLVKVGIKKVKSCIVKLIPKTEVQNDKNDYKKEELIRKTVLPNAPPTKYNPEKILEIIQYVEEGAKKTEEIIWKVYNHYEEFCRKSAWKYIKDKRFDICTQFGIHTFDEILKTFPEELELFREEIVDLMNMNLSKKSQLLKRFSEHKDKEASWKTFSYMISNFLMLIGRKQTSDNILNYINLYYQVSVFALHKGIYKHIRSRNKGDFECPAELLNLCIKIDEEERKAFSSCKKLFDIIHSSTKLLC